MPLEKYEDFLELSVKAICITITSNFPWPDNVWCVKNQTLMLLVAKLARYFSYRTRVMQVQVYTFFISNFIRDFRDFAIFCQNGESWTP